MQRNGKGQFVKGGNLENNNGYIKGNIPWNKNKKTGIIPRSAYSKDANRKEIEWITDDNGCWICTSHSVNKYGYVQCNLMGHKRMHRLFYSKYKGEIPIGIFVCHSCDNPSCINPDHLFLGTHKDNMKDKTIKNRQHKPNGEKNGMSKLTEEQIYIIKFLLPELNHREVAETYNLSQQHVGSIRNNKLWKHIVEKENTYVY